MTLRRRLITSIFVLVAVGLAALDILTLSSLHSYLYGRVDAQLTSASRLVTSFVLRTNERGYAVTAGSIASRVPPDIYVELIDSHGTVVVSRPSMAQGGPEPAPDLPHSLPTLPAADRRASGKPGQIYRPNATSINASAVGGRGPDYRVQATSVPGGTVIVATSLESTTATLASLRNIVAAVSIGLLAALLLLMTLIIRLGLRPLEDMATEAGAIAAGDLTRRVKPTEGEGEIPRLGRALNLMLSQIETAFAQRSRSEERLRSFLADASHELRTPLTSIRGYAELLQKDALDDPDARARALSRIEREAARMGDLVGDLAILAREGDGPEPTRYRVDLSEVATEAVADVRAFDDSRLIGLDAPTPVPVDADHTRLEQMLHNLLGNALTHTPSGTPVDVRVRAQHGEAVLEVSDAGPGMSAEQASHVFDRFYRGDAERLDGGSGLGLFIVASLARTFGGRVAVDTAPGEGSTFRVVLPLHQTRIPPDAVSAAVNPPSEDRPRYDTASTEAAPTDAAPTDATAVTVPGAG